MKPTIERTMMKMRLFFSQKDWLPEEALEVLEEVFDGVAVVGTLEALGQSVRGWKGSLPSAGALPVGVEGVTAVG